MLARARVKVAADSLVPGAAGGAAFKLPKPAPISKIEDKPNTSPAPPAPNTVGGMFGGNGGIFGNMTNQNPEGVAKTLTNPLFKPISQMFLGATGMPGLGFLSSQMGTSGGKDWSTLVQGKPTNPPTVPGAVNQ